MVHLDLSKSEAESLEALLTSDLADLRYEISNTDSLDYRNTLKKKREYLTRVLEALTASRQTV